MFNFFLLRVLSVEPPSVWGPTPNARQMQYHQEEFSSFIHYGINTYSGLEWGDGSEDPNIFKPTNLNTDQWVQTFKKAGIKRTIMVGKHHDGFCNWKTKFSNHQVNESRDFQDISSFLRQSGDVLEELSKSCTKYNMNMGLYLSPWDVNSSYYGDENLYNIYYMNLLDEIINSENKKYGNNGKFVEIWLDGAKGEGSKAQIYWFSKWFDMIYRLQENVVIFSGYGTEIRWVGNEDGKAGEPCWNKIDFNNEILCSDKKPGCVPEDLSHGDPNGPNYSIAEVDVSITDGWFWKEGKVPKSSEELTSIYFTSIARGQPLLLNIPPNKEGKIPDDIAERVIEFGENRHQTFTLDFARLKNVTTFASNVRGKNDTSNFKPENVFDGNNETYWTMEDGLTKGSITIDLGKYRTFDIVDIQEHILLGQRISKFSIEVHLENDKWQIFDHGTTIGFHRVCRFLPVTANQIRVNVLESQAVPLIQKIGVYRAANDFAVSHESNSSPDGLCKIDPKSPLVDKTGNWYSESEGVYTYQKGASLHSLFIRDLNDIFENDDQIASYVFVTGTVDKSYGSFDVYIDDAKVDSVDVSKLYQNKRKVRQLLYQADLTKFKFNKYSKSEHALKLVSTDTKVIKIHEILYFNNKEKNLFEFSQKVYKVKEGEKLSLQIKRLGGNKGESGVVLQIYNGSAVKGENFDFINKLVESNKIELKFKEGESEKTFDIQTFANSDKKINDLAFYATIADEEQNAIVGFNFSTKILINI